MEPYSAIFLEPSNEFTGDFSKHQAVVGNRRRANLAENVCQSFDAVFAKAQKVEIACLTMWKTLPKRKERRALQDEAARVRGNREPEKQAFDGETCQHLLEIIAVSNR